MNPCTYSQCKTSTLRHPFTRFFTLEMEGVYENALCKSCVAEKGKINVQPIRNRVRTCFNHLKNCASFQCNFPSEYELIKSFSCTEATKHFKELFKLTKHSEPHQTHPKNIPSPGVVHVVDQIVSDLENRKNEYENIPLSVEALEGFKRKRPSKGDLQNSLKKILQENKLSHLEKSLRNIEKDVKSLQKHHPQPKPLKEENTSENIDPLFHPNLPSITKC
eukprot:Sdes_comp18161_c0_seq3m7657